VGTSIAAREVGKHAATLVSRMDQEVARLGRSTSARNAVPKD